MNLFGLSITRQKAAVPALSSVDGRTGGWYRVLESFAGAWQSNVTVDLTNVLTYSPVFACARLISSDIGKLRLRLVQQDEYDIWTPTDVPAFSPVLRQPNRYQGHIKFVQQWLLSKLIHGNAYILKQRDSRRVVTALYVLDPCRVRPAVAPDGSVWYQLGADNLSGLTESVTIPASEIIHDVYLALYHPLMGLSPISACGVAAVEALRIQDASTVFFGNGSKPGGILTAPGAISQDTATRLQDAWDTNFTGDNAGKVAVLGDGLKYAQLSVNAHDAQLIEQLKWTAEDVCTAFGVPPYKINVGPPPNYNNVEALDRQYYSQCLQELMETFEELLDFGLGLAPDPVNGRRLGTEFCREDLLQMDTLGRVDAAQKSIIAGMSPNEVRKRYHDLGPVKGGDVPFMQEQNWPITLLAARTEAPSTKPAPQPPADPPIAPPTAQPPKALDPDIATAAIVTMAHRMAHAA